MRAMMQLLLVVLGAAAPAAGAGCKPSGPEPPQAVFERLRVVAAVGDRAKLYDHLDTESRWAVDTVWKYQREIAEIVARDFPEERRARELARVAEAQAARTPRDFFAATTYLEAPLGGLGVGAQALGRYAGERKVSPEKVEVLTDTGAVVPLVLAEGRWGYAGLQSALLQWKHAAANDRQRIEDDADLYRRERASASDGP